MSRRHAPLQIALSFLLASPFSTSAADTAEPAPAQTVVPSRLVPDDRGILRLEPGTDGKDALALANDLSVDVASGHLVVVVLTNDKYEEQAIAHGLKLKAWFEKQVSTRDCVPLVVHKNDKGVGYVYFMYGFPYIHDELAPTGTMTVQESVKLLDNARLVHMARGHIWDVDLAEARRQRAIKEMQP